MTRNPKVLKAVVVARTRLRDLAAASEARARDDHQHATRAVEDADAMLDRTLDQARDRLAASTSVADLMRVDDEITGDRASRDDAAVGARQAEQALAQARAELRQRARQLRSIEHVLEVDRTTRASRAAREEQRVADDRGVRREDE